MATRTSTVPVMLRSPVALDSRSAEENGPDAQGVAALDPQLDAPVGMGPKRTVPPIGAPSSPIAPTTFSYDNGPVSGGLRKPYVSPLASSTPGYSVSEHQLQSWSWETADGEPTFGRLEVERKSASRSIAEVAADDVLNESLESLHLDPSISRGSRVAPMSLPGHQQLFHNPNNATMSPYEQQNLFERNLYPNEGRTHPVQSPSTPLRDSAPRSRSILLRNLPPGVDDDSLRILLGRHGELRDLGAQQRVRGGRGSVIATFFDLRHACAAFAALDGSYQFGRRIEARFHSPIHSMPRSPLQPQNSSDNSEASSPRRGGNGKRGTDNQTFGSPHSSPSKSALPSPSNHGTLVVFNLDPSTTAEEIRSLFGSIGDVKEIRSTPNKRHHKFVEFFDVRDAERALVALNKTEVGGKKIKIEISRPGGRGNSSKSTSGSHATGHRFDESRHISNGQNSHQFSIVRTPPSMPVAGFSLSGQSRQDPSLAFSPLEGSTSSPFPTSFPSVPSHDGGRSHSGGLPHQLGVDVGNTNPQDHSFFSNASSGAPVSPSTGFFNSLRQHQASPYSSSDLHDVPGLQIGGNNGGEVLKFEPLGGGNSTDGMFENNGAHLRTTRNSWTNYPPVYSASPDDLRRLVPDNVGIPISGSSLDSVPQHRIGGVRFMAQSAPRESGFELQSRLDDSDLQRNPSYSPRSFRNVPLRSRGFARVLDLGPSSSHFSRDGYPNQTSPDDKDRTVRPSTRRFAEPGCTTKEMGNGSSIKETQPPRKHLYSTVLRMSGQEAAARRANTVANRTHSGSSSSNHSNNSNTKNCLDISKVISGEDSRTALMIRNIPNKYNQRMLLSALDENHRGHFDFIYLPIDFKNKCNVGYAFINFTCTQHIPSFYDEFHGHKWGRFNSEKVCEICYARIQGKSSLVNHFANSSLMNEDPKCRPVVFDANGKQEEFPVGSNVRTRRGPSARDSNRLTHEQSPPFSPMKQRGRCH